MEPRLIAVSGPLEGSVYDLGAAEVSIGRHPSSTIPLEDLLVSRRHCLIRNKAGEIRVTDLGSSGGTFVNGLPVGERVLEHGDRLAIGDSVFVFSERPGDLPAAAAPAAEAVLEQEDTGPGTFTRLKPGEATYLHPEKAPRDGQAATRAERDLNLLLKVSRAVHSVRDPRTLQEKLLEEILDALPVQRAALLLLGRSADRFESVLVLDREEGHLQRARVSRTITQMVLREGEAILSNDVGTTEGLKASESLLDSGVRSVLCVPLAAPARVIGLLYMDSSEPETPFDERHLDLAAAIGGVAAVALENARRVSWLEGETQRLRADLEAGTSMVGDSPKMKELFDFIGKAAPTDATILVRGETGTGKELVARAIHANSPRSGKPFVAINCAALTETLLESELFGHEKGAFTGAIAQKKGKLEVAEGGSVFLDEVGEMAPGLQAKLLRVLQEREMERVGGTRKIEIDIRLIAATNRDLEREVAEGRFRRDLFYRLNVVAVTTPPLRERREDIPLLTDHFVRKYAQRFKIPVPGVSIEARARLMRYDWPGNVRELENAIERAVVLGAADGIRPEDLPETLLEARPEPGESGEARFHEALRETKRRLILEALSGAGGNLSEAARRLGIHRNYLHRMINNLDLRDEIAGS